jgi:hypothetical protein
VAAARAESVAAKVEADSAKILAQTAANTANQSMGMTQTLRADMKGIEERLTRLEKAQDLLTLNASKKHDLPADQSTGLVPRSEEMSECSIFLAGIPAFRRRLNMSDTADPVYVTSYLLRTLEIYTGMDSIVIADNAAQDRLSARAVIIHMRSYFHKRAAMAILRRELAIQRLPDTAVRDCFPTRIMGTVKRYIRFAMGLKTAGKIDKFQVINKKGKPYLQTGMRNQQYINYPGDVDRESQQADDDRQGATARVDTWATVGKKGKKVPDNRKTAGQQSADNTADRPADWVQMVEEEFPALTAAKKQTKVNSKQPQPVVPQPGTNSGEGKQRQTAASTFRDQLSKPTAASSSNSTTEKSNAAPKQRRNSNNSNNQASRQNSRAGSRNSSRQHSRERQTAPHEARDKMRDNTSNSTSNSNGGGRVSTPPPFRGQFEERRSSNSGNGNSNIQQGLPQRERAAGTRRADHDQYHRNR